MAFDPVTAVVDLIKTGLDKFVPDKMDEKDKQTLVQNMEMFTAKEARNENSSFRSFIVEYEGAAKDVPKLIVIIRALIRPLFTILVGYLDYLYFTGTGFTPEQGGLLKSVNVIVLFFWFGERAVTNSGILDKLIKRKGGD
jgi:hypothetical protein